jgi:hypothetical protein
MSIFSCTNLFFNLFRIFTPTYQDFLFLITIIPSYLTSFYLKFMQLNMRFIPRVAHVNLSIHLFGVLLYFSMDFHPLHKKFYLNNYFTRLKVLHNLLLADISRINLPHYFILDLNNFTVDFYFKS